MQLVGQLAFSCLITAIVEEVAFRGVLTSLFARRFSGPSGLLHAALASSVTFALLHVASDLLANAGDPVLVLQALLKTAQTGLFGFCMACLFLKARLWGRALAGALTFPILIHFAFDLAYFGPGYLSTGAFPDTYLTGSCGDLAVLALTAALLLPLSIYGARSLWGEVLPCPPRKEEKGA